MSLALAAILSLAVSWSDDWKRVPPEVAAAAWGLASDHLASGGLELIWVKDSEVVVFVLPLDDPSILGMVSPKRSTSIWLFPDPILRWGHADLKEAYARLIVHEVLHTIGCHHGPAVMKAQLDPAPWSAEDTEVVRACVAGVYKWRDPSQFRRQPI